MKITGTSIDSQTSAPLAHQRIELWAGERRPRKIAEAETDAAGKFVLTYDPAGLPKLTGEETPRVALKLYQGTVAVDVATGPGEWTAGQEPQGDLNIGVKPSTGDRAVKGRVLHVDGTPVKGVTIHAYHLGFKSETSLGTTTTTAEGTYELHYQRAAGAPDLFVRAFVAHSKTVLATSHVIYAALPRERIDLTVTDAHYRGPSEYARIDKVLAPLLGSGTQALLASLNTEDVAALVEKTGIARTQVAHYIAARRIHLKTHLAAEAVYGLLRQGAPASTARHVSTPDATVKRLLARASDRNVVSLKVGADAAAVSSTMKTALAHDAVATTSPRGVGHLLATAGLDAERQQAFMTKYTHHQGTVRQFWTGLRADPAWGDAVVDNVQRSLQYGRLTVNHAPLVQALTAAGSRVGRPRDTVRLTRADWLALIDSTVDNAPVGVPNGVKGATPEEKRSNYAGILLRQAELAFPTAAVAEDMRRKHPVKTRDVVTFLDQNHSFHFGTSRVSAVLADPTTNLAGIGDPAVLAPQLESYQRVYKIAPETGKYTTMSTLVDAGLDSALAVQRIDRNAFVSDFSTDLGEDDAKTVYGNAVAQSAAALTMLTVHAPAYQGAQVAAVPYLAATTASGVAGIPDYRTLFGSIDYCQCEHCRSILSPAAYFVDLLNWLDLVAPTEESGSSTTPGAVDELLRRRPDLGTMELSCDNTNIPLPYVDLVNEILENGVAEVEGKDLVDHDVTGVTAQELLANPEHVNVKVYEEVLPNKFYPFTLPFHLPNTQARVFLRQLGVERWDLMETFQRGNDPTDVAIATEYLELTSTQREHIIGTAEQDQWTLWGYDAETGNADPRGGTGTVGYRKALQYVPEFLDRAAIEYIDLLDLLHTDFVNADESLRIVSTGESICNLDEMEIERIDATTTAIDAPTALQFGHLRRFIRLWRALDCTILELDKTLLALNGADDIVDKTIRQIADLRRIRKLVKIDLLPLLSWWSAIDLKEDRDGADPEVLPLYDRVFLNHAIIVDAATWPFYLNDDRNELLDATDPTSTRLAQDVAAELQAALGVAAEDLDAAEAQVAIDLGTAVTALPVNLDVLSRLYRITTMAKALKLSVEDALAYSALVDLDPFAGPQEARLFIEEVQEIKKTGFSIDDLLYLLGHDPDAALVVAPSEDSLAVTLSGLRAGLQKIKDETVAVESDATGEITRQYLTQIVPAEDLEDVMAVIDGSYVPGTAEDGTPDPTAEDIAEEHLSPFLHNPVAKLVTDATEITAIEDRYAYVLTGLVPYLAQMQGENLIKEQMASALGLELAAAEDLLVDRVEIDGQTALAIFSSALFVDGVEATAGAEATSGVDADLNPTDQADAFDALTLLHEIAAILTRFDIDADEQAWIFDHEDTLGVLRLANLPLEEVDAGMRYAKWKSLADLISARDRLPGTTPTLWELLDLVLVYGLSTDPDTTDDTHNSFLDDTASRTGWSADDLEYVIDALGYGDPASPTDPHPLANGAALVQVIDCMELVTRIATAAETVDGWRAADLGLDSATDVVMAVKSHHDVARWPAVARPLRDQLRDRQRAALVAYLVEAKGLDDENDLYAEYLIDVEMSPCMLTSRIKQGISSVQLFIQRCFLNLEPPADSTAEISLTATDDERWDWMKTYRVWEANRKVFLYPENWIEPELRDDKTPFFRDLESALMQDEITDEKVETAYLDYLAKLLEVNRLEIAGLYHQEDTTDGVLTDVLHVFARTRGNPRTYYYRRWEDATEWTAWEKVEVDIEGDHLIPVVHERRLMLLWLVLTEQSSDTTDYWNVQIAWSEYWDGRWSPKKLSVDAVATSYRGAEMNYYVRTNKSGGDLLINVRDMDAEYMHDATTAWFARFRLKCDGTMLAEDMSGRSPLIVPLTLGAEGQTFQDILFFDDDDLFLTTGEVNGHGDLEDGTEDTSVLVLSDGPSPRVVSYLHQYDQFCSQGPFFIADDDRTFFVQPKTTVGPVAPNDLANDAIDLGQIGGYDDPGGYEPPYDPGPVYVPTGIKFYEPDEPETMGPEPDQGGGERSRTSGASSARTTGSTTGSTTGTSSGAATTGTAAFQLQQTQNELAKVDSVDNGTMMWVDDVTKYLFQTFYHPYVCKLIEQLRRDGVEAMLSPDETKRGGDETNSLVRQQLHDDYFETAYKPTSVVLDPYPRDDFDFTYGTAYAQYNWELFFHAPLLLADRLRRNQRFDEALRWFHFIFDPMNQNKSWDVPARYWKIKPFLEAAGEEPKAIQDLLALLPESSTDPDADAVQEQLRAEIDAWLDDPFDPHAIARLRTTAYQKTVVMKYLDNLIEWGDYLFRQDTIETINQATQLYVLALEILGDKPEEIPPRAEVQNQTFNELRALGLDELSNTLVQIETDLLAPADPSDADGTLLDSVSTLYFCVPLNDKLFGYWTTIEDRLFKIRHCMNIQGVVRQLPLFEPPIDPGLLVRAAAAGIDLSSAIADLSAPRPHYRFTSMMQRAQAFCGTVRSLGGALLSALEKRDAEEMAKLRSGHELAVLVAARDVRKLAVNEAREQQTALERSLDVVSQRRDYYAKLIDDDLNPKELQQIAKLKAAKWAQLIGGTLEAVAGILHIIPDIEGPFPPKLTSGGSFMGAAAEAAARSSMALGTWLSNEAQLAGINAGYDRRKAEWTQQQRAADKEAKQIDKQIAAADIRVAMAEKELANQELQIENARASDALMRDKYTNRDLYDWTVSQVSSIYFQSYQLANDLAKRAERCYQHELAAPDASFVQFGHWDSLKKGLLAGDRLQYDLERCEAAYLENDQREYEITKHVSLAGLDPVALVQLRESDTCFFTLPEAAFDLDFPGHYLRRIKSVAMTVPCVAGPYTGVNCTLTLSKSSVRVDPSVSSDYPYPRLIDEDDPRFRDELEVESIVTSVGQNDAGLFEPSLQDPRYLPFERRGAADSQWQLTLAGALPQFDPRSISDVVLHVRYTAREGGSALKGEVVSTLGTQLAAMAMPSGGAGLMRLFSARHEMPDAWNAFLNPAAAATQQTLELDLAKDRFPYPFQTDGLAISRFQILLVLSAPPASATVAVDVTSGTTSIIPTSTPKTLATASDWANQLLLDFAPTPPPSAGTFTLTADKAGMDALGDDQVVDLLVIATYTIGS